MRFSKKLSKKLVFVAFLAAWFAAASQSVGVFAEEVRSSSSSLSLSFRLFFGDSSIFIVNERARSSLTIILVHVPFVVGGCQLDCRF